MNEMNSILNLNKEPKMFYKKRPIAKFEEKGMSLTCDNESCDFDLKIDASQLDMGVLETFINTPCPNCKENLLTQEDFKRYQSVVSFIKFINRWFSWTTIFIKPKGYKKAVVNTHKKTTFNLED